MTRFLMLLEPHTTPIIEMPVVEIPTVEIKESLFEQAGVRLLVKRLDLVHPIISGNKWYKLKYNLLAAHEQGCKTLLSFGGAYSNHIHALAGAGSSYGFKTIGVIRGEAHTPLNDTLQFAVDQGMHLHYMSRADYRLKQTPALIAQLRERYGDFYLVPEGGTNTLAVKGAKEIVDDLDDDVDLVACACGTGGTLAGVVAGLNGQCQALGVAVLKGASFLKDDVRRLLDETGHGGSTNWSINLNYHFGGYAKTKPELLLFLKHFEQQHAIPLDPVYTVKLTYALYAMIEAGEIARGTTVLALHTGGLQGRMGFDLN
ncbi:1-aminocyclopropane-1-carboxylate deaminase/D-cysteine desulfhydrase [Pseudomonadota bacterium]